MQTTRGRSVYVTLNLAWFFALCFVVFLAGMAVQSWQDGKTDKDELLQCPICHEKVRVGSEDFLPLHAACARAIDTIKEPVPDAPGEFATSEAKRIAHANEDTGP